MYYMRVRGWVWKTLNEILWPQTHFILNIGSQFYITTVIDLKFNASIDYKKQAGVVFESIVRKVKLDFVAALGNQF